MNLQHGFGAVKGSFSVLIEFLMVRVDLFLEAGGLSTIGYQQISNLIFILSMYEGVNHGVNETTMNDNIQFISSCRGWKERDWSN